LIGDLTHICQESKVGARINTDLVLVLPAVKECFRERALELAITGGEDYELLFTASPTVMNRVKKALQCPVTVIGEIIEGNANQVNLVDSAGRIISNKKTGWDHFKVVSNE
jgi:thiamine-monophosphate kinase